MIAELLGNPQPGDPIGETGLVWHPSMDIHDASKIQTFMNSPRDYFFKYVLGWQQEDPNIHLVFGSAWHKAMEHLLLSLNTDAPYSNKILVEAFELFMEEYRMRYPNEYADDQNGAKAPDNALKALAGYAATWGRSDIGKYQTLYTEIAVTVPVSETRLVHGKLDSIVLEDGSYIRSMEHKTTGRKTEAWVNQWEVILQPWVYTHALNCVFTPEIVKGVTINGAILRQKENEFLRIPVAKSSEMMRSGLWAVNHWLDQIEWNWQNLIESSPDEDILPAFACNGTSCSKFGCSYSAFCGTWGNPLRRAHRPPPGFKQEFWDPRREQDDVKYRLDLSQGTDIVAVGEEAERPAEP